MNRLGLTLALLGSCGLALAGGGGDPAGTGADVKSLAVQAVSGNTDQRSQAIAALRAAGPAGLDALLASVDPWLRRYDADEAFSGPDAETWERVRAALDGVSRQRDCHASRLFWFTDLPAALAAAAEAKKPVLSLRLLGNLDDELSCANSRFFRTALYANAQSRSLLRARYILHWQSERPAPVVTIDFGDGRVLKRTVTGNSIHYVLAQDGTVLNAIPGLIAPREFYNELSGGLRPGLSHLPSLQPGVRRNELLMAAALIAEQWTAALARAALPADASAAAVNEGGAQTAAPSAADASLITYSKRRAEAPTLAALSQRVEQLTARTSDALWLRLGDGFREAARLDASSRRLLRSKCRADEPLERVIERFEHAIAVDTAYNRFVLQRRIFERLAATDGALEPLNAWVYAELFLTPRSDPWLGLLPEATYAALPEGGVIARPAVKAAARGD